ncbi:MAG: hypothetical protein KJO33_15215 [Gammaproteobacteria bacterium]|nr:hypothetical protein [Gammaproteobacteria bacterium]NNK31819.1 hypothetical protein [Xanthomonadales bacterium]
MGNSIFFWNEDGLLVQEDEINRKASVKLYCNTPFAIEFEPAYSDENRDTSDSDDPLQGNERRFESRPLSNNSARRHRIKIKFKDVPDSGFKYTVFADGLELDPRVVPPK